MGVRYGTGIDSRGIQRESCSVRGREMRVVVVVVVASTSKSSNSFILHRQDIIR